MATSCGDNSGRLCVTLVNILVGLLELKDGIQYLLVFKKLGKQGICGRDMGRDGDFLKYAQELRLQCSRLEKNRGFLTQVFQEPARPPRALCAVDLQLEVQRSPTEAERTYKLPQVDPAPKGPAPHMCQAVSVFLVQGVS